MTWTRCSGQRRPAARSAAHSAALRAESEESTPTTMGATAMGGRCDTGLVMADLLTTLLPASVVAGHPRGQGLPALPGGRTGPPRRAGRPWSDPTRTGKLAR